MHAFHRECIYKKLKSYHTKDPRVDRTVRKICGLFAKIETIKAKAAFVNSELNAGSGSSMSMMGKFGLGGNSSQGQQSSNMFSYDDTNKNSLISDIKSYITKSIKPGFGGPGSGGPNAHNQQILHERDQKEIRDTLNQIDDYLTRECFYCGSLLLDMVDNDVFNVTGVSKDYEFFQVSLEDAQAIAQHGEDEWKIK